MRPKLQLVALIIFSLLACSTAFADKKPMTNNDVIKMVKAGLTAQVIVEAIKSSDTNFDLSADALILLKQEGVPDAVLQAMIAKSNPSSGSQPAVGSSNESIGNIVTNVILIDGSTQIPMQRTVPSGARTGGVGMKVLNPFAKVKSFSTLNGNQAQVRTNSASPTFEVSLPADLNPSDAIVLVKFEVKSDRRQVSTARGRLNMSSGFDKDDVIPITTDAKQSASAGADRVYTVSLVKPLKKGEYAIVIQNAIYYDFGVDGSK